MIESSVLEQISGGRYRLNRARELPWLEQSFRNVRNVKGEAAHLGCNLKHGVQRPEAIGQLGQLGPQHVVIGGKIEVELRGTIDHLPQLLVLIYQLLLLPDQFVEMLLLPDPRPSRRFAVRQLSLPLPLVHIGAWARWLILRRRHSSRCRDDLAFALVFFL